MKLLTDIIHSSDDIRIEPTDKVKMEFQRYVRICQMWSLINLMLMAT